MNSDSNDSSLRSDSWHNRFPHGLLITPALIRCVAAFARLVLEACGMNRLEALILPLVGLAALAVIVASPIALFNRGSAGISSRQKWMLLTVHSTALLLAFAVIILAGYGFYQINLE